MPKDSIADRIIYSTTKLSTFSAGGNPIGTGTGFFYTVPVDDAGPGLIANLVITNKHVLADAIRMRITFHVRSETDPPEPTGEVITWEFDVNPLWGVVPHPDPNVDLCTVNISVPLNEMRRRTGKRPYFVAIGRANLPTAEDWAKFDSVEEVIMIGCPRGIFDEKNNIPIVRRGITATSLTRLYNGKQEFMVDMACFPGSSGSPIWIYDYDGHWDRASGSFKAGVMRYFLVGVLWGGPMMSADGEVVQPNGPRVEVSTPMHLGYAVRATEIIALEDAFLARRKEAVARQAAREAEHKR